MNRFLGDETSNNCNHLYANNFIDEAFFIPRWNHPSFPMNAQWCKYYSSRIQEVKTGMSIKWLLVCLGVDVGVNMMDKQYVKWSRSGDGMDLQCPLNTQLKCINYASVIIQIAANCTYALYLLLVLTISPIP